MYDYLKNYADQFHITERIRFQTKVLLIDKDDLKDPHLPWMITVENADGHQQTLEFDFVVIATGLFSTPYMPIFRDQNKFAGSIVHTSDIKTLEGLGNKHVVIIGGGKSAFDLATLAGTHARSCHMILRRAHWLVPHKLVHGYLPLEYIFSRAFTITCDPYPNAPHSALYHFLYRKFSFLLKKVFEQISTDVLTTYQADLFDETCFLPKGSFENSENYIYITDEFLKLKREGRIVRKLASIDEVIDERTIQLDSGEMLQADMIICATGYIEQFPFLSEALSQRLGQNPTDERVDLDLYRRLIPVGVPNIAFIGFAAAAYQWLCFEVQSHWTSDYFLGRIQLPPLEQNMYDEIRTIRNFIRKRFNRMSYYIQYYWLEPIEIYLQDMGLSLHRTNNWISEYFGIYRPKRMRSLHEERQARADGKAIKHWYFGFGHTILLCSAIFFIYFLMKVGKIFHLLLSSSIYQ